MSVVIETTAGDFTIDLYTEERPRACLNFLKLCRTKYYNCSLFHKIERNFTAQTGDPTDTGRGGESVFSQLYGEQAKFFEAETKPRMKHINIGTVSMVNNGDDMHGSQFFITLGENLDFLDGVHTVFAQVIEGIDILMKINDTICDTENRPYQDIRITHTVILDDPYDDPPGLLVPDKSPEPSTEHLRTSRIGVDEDIDDTKGKSLDEIEEEIQDKEAKARATILEMVGDIPDSEVKPPDNVLFVCKLNPVTTAEDLEVIFVRFGKILSCEVIKDRKSGESLQYAFIEFEDPNECENAYFKMDNVLIDDRRIHVDFSQSVSKLNWQEMRKNATSTFKKPQFRIKNSQSDHLKNPKYDLIFQNEPKEGKHVDHDEKEKSRHHKHGKRDKSSHHKHDRKDKSAHHKYETKKRLSPKRDTPKFTGPNRSDKYSKSRQRSRSRSRDRYQDISRIPKMDKYSKHVNRHDRKRKSVSPSKQLRKEHHSRRSSSSEKDYRRKIHDHNKRHRR